MSSCGKGDVRRPRLVARKVFESNWDQIFEKSTDKVNQELEELIEIRVETGDPAEFWAEDLED